MKEKRKGIIYKYTNKINGKVYIGQTVNEEKRKKEHRGAYGNYPFHRAIRKYGWDNFDYEVVFTTISSDLDRLKYLLDTMEKYFIKKYNSFGEGGYNCTLGGGGSLGRKQTEEAKKRISEKNSGKKPSEETRRKLSIASRNMSAETRRKLSIAGTGRKHTEEAKRKISESKKGKPHTLSEEARRKQIERLGKPTAQYSLDGVLICTYSSTAEAVKQNNYPKYADTSIQKVCRGIIKSAYGYNWRYIN